MQVSIEAGQPEDRSDIVRLLTDNGLPPDGLPDNPENVLVARLGDRVVGSAALEIYADGALLRSVAVEDTLRGSGIGHRIVRAALDLARLTTTAETFFPRFGFRRIARADVPTGVQTSVEFQSACPATAVVMVLTITGR